MMNIMTIMTMMRILIMNIDDDADDDNDHKKDIYTAPGAAPDAGAAPGSWPYMAGPEAPCSQRKIKPGSTGGND